MSGRIEAWLYGSPEAALAEAVGIQVTEPGPTVYVSRLLAPARLSDALTAWAADMTANLTGTYTLAWDASAQSVTISATGVASFAVDFGGNLAAALGFSASSGHTGALTYSGDQQALARYDSLIVGAPGVIPHEDVEMLRYEHGRYAAIAWSQVDAVEARVYGTQARIDSLSRSYCAAGRVRLTMDDSSAAAYPDAAGGYVDGPVLAIDSVEHDVLRGRSSLRIVVGRGRG